MITGTTGNWTAWPECPQCHARREVRCPLCLASDIEFRLADFEEPEDSEEGESDAEVLLLCSTCDEPFTPEFYRSCAECGFDFGDGIERSEIVREELNNRVVLVMVGLALLVIGLLGFFAIVLRG